MQIKEAQRYQIGSSYADITKDYALTTEKEIPLRCDYSMSEIKNFYPAAHKSFYTTSFT